jgi:hypothetical protein
MKQLTTIKYMKRTIINGKKLTLLLLISHTINFLCYMIFYYDAGVWGPMDISTHAYGYYSTFTFSLVILHLIMSLFWYMATHWNDKDILDNLKKSKHDKYE